MSVVLKKKIDAIGKTKKALEASYLQLRKQLSDNEKHDSTDKNSNSFWFGLLSEYDELRFEIEYAKSFIQNSDKNSDTEKVELFKVFDAFREHDEVISASSLFSMAPELPSLRRQVTKAADEAAKLNAQEYNTVHSGHYKRSSEEVKAPSKRRKSQIPSGLTWLDSSLWSKNHVKYILQGCEGKRTTPEKTSGVQDLYKDKLGVIISSRAVFYFFLHYGIRDLSVDNKVINHEFNVAYLKYRNFSSTKRLELIRTHIKEKLHFHISKNDTSCGIQFRDVLSKVYGSINEPEDNFIGLESETRSTSNGSVSRSRVAKQKKKVDIEKLMNNNV